MSIARGQITRSTPPSRSLRYSVKYDRLFGMLLQRSTPDSGLGPYQMVILEKARDGLHRSFGENMDRKTSWTNSLSEGRK